MTIQPQIRRPLDGMLVLDLGQIYNGPYCGLQLSFMGARVLKIEPPEGDVVRRRKREVEPYPLVMLNSNKESVVLDFKQPRGKELFLALVEKADVLIVNPTHVAVALRYNAESMAAPLVVAKGLDEVELRMRAVARECGVPVAELPPLARWLESRVEVGQAVPPVAYAVVARALAWAYGPQQAPPEAVELDPAMQEAPVLRSRAAPPDN